MGDWRKDQSKKTRRYTWGQTRGQNDETLEDFLQRVKAFPAFASLRFEKIGSEIHAWRSIREDSGSLYWASCLRFADDGWGYWTVFYRLDERRWRVTDARERPLGQALAGAAEWYRSRFIDSVQND
ncbi:MAG: hypothetical protein A2992_03325 [Elusimicrobia bacterium RIFCSPLOWO2_01_FULL_59_12]|nr:MAG: hypothetical protein A2992_03325 [Elusimicrobia bacterium RIFCSPLOWO2_01_FULL_59_12]